VPLTVGIGVATAAVFARSLTCGFVGYDDRGYVVENAHVLAGWSAGGLRWAFTTTQQANWHPLTWLSLMADASLGGREPRRLPRHQRGPARARGASALPGAAPGHGGPLEAGHGGGAVRPPSPEGGVGHLDLGAKGRPGLRVLDGDPAGLGPLPAARAESLAGRRRPPLRTRSPREADAGDASLRARPPGDLAPGAGTPRLAARAGVAFSIRAPLRRLLRDHDVGAARRGCHGLAHRVPVRRPLRERDRRRRPLPRSGPVARRPGHPLPLPVGDHRAAPRGHLPRSCSPSSPRWRSGPAIVGLGHWWAGSGTWGRSSPSSASSRWGSNRAPTGTPTSP
jgi:hypothetical protein